MHKINEFFNKRFKANLLKYFSLNEDEISKKISKWDKLFGLRAYGLVIYGTFPAYLALIDVTKVRIENFDNISPYLFIIILSLPVLAVFLFIRSKYKDWYLTTDYLNTRSMFTTLGILSIAAFISEISGVLQNRYVFGIPNDCSWEALKPTFESLSVAVISLTISSTFIFTNFSKETDLPGFPSNEFVKATKELIREIKKLKKSDIWTGSVSCSEIKELEKTVIGIKDIFNNIDNLRGNWIAKKSFRIMSLDFCYLKETITKIIEESSSPESFDENVKKYFSEHDEHYFESITDKKERQKIESIKNLNNLKLGD